MELPSVVAILCVVLNILKFSSIKDGFHLQNIKMSAGVRSGAISSICDTYMQIFLYPKS